MEGASTMSYERIPYDPDAPSEVVELMFGMGTATVPRLEYPIPIKENFMRAARRENPLWVPNSITDMVGMTTLDPPPDPTSEEALKKPEDERLDYDDIFGCRWTFVPVAGGPMLKPNFPPVMDDICEWESQVTFPAYDECIPNLEEMRAAAAKGHAEGKVIHVDIGQGCTERLVALMGGYTQSMIAMGEEPEAVRDFFEAYADWFIGYFEAIRAATNPDMVTFHDDWGTERNTFFSEAMMEEMVLEPSIRMAKAIKDTGAAFQLHSCGCIGRFVPYMIEMGVDFIQLQRRANDVPELKRVYGDKIGFNTMLEGISPGQPATKDELIAAVHETVDLYAKDGGLYTMAFHPDPELMWYITQELFYYSREYYEANA